MCLTAELAVGADLARDARHLRGEDAQLLDHRVDDVGRAQELALERAAVDLELHRVQEIAARHRGDRARHRGGGPEQVVDEAVHRDFHLAPGSRGEAELHALARFSLAPDHQTHGLQLLRHPLVGGDDLVEGLGDFPGDAGSTPRQANGKIALAHGLERIEQDRELEGLLVCAAVGAGQRAVLRDRHCHGVR